MASTNKILEGSLEARDYWYSVCPEGYILIGWSYRHSAIFQSEDGEQIKVTAAHVRFFQQNAPDDES